MKIKKRLFLPESRTGEERRGEDVRLPETLPSGWPGSESAGRYPAGRGVDSATVTRPQRAGLGTAPHSAHLLLPHL